MIGVWKGVWKNGGGRSVERTFLPSIGSRRRNRGKSCVEIGGGGKKGNGEGLVRFDRNEKGIFAILAETKVKQK